MKPAFLLGLAASALVTTTFIVAAPVDRPAPLAQAQSVTADPGYGLFTQMCSDCHDADRIVSMRRTKDDWQDVIGKMIEKGATGTEKDFIGVFEFLQRNYGKVYVNTAPADEIGMVLGLVKKDADAVVAYRTANGPFKVADDLKKVPDIDVKKLDDHKDAIAF